MFLAWYEKEADEKGNIIFQSRTFACDGTRDHIPHFHGSIEIIFAIKGGFDAFLNDECYTVNTGEIFFVNSFEAHRYYYTKGNECFVVVISADHFDAENRLGEISFPTLNPYNEGFDRIAEFLRFSYENWDNSSAAYKRGFANMLIGMMQRYYPTVKKAERAKNNEVLVDAVKYINENSRVDLGIEELSAKFGYTPNYFSNIFNRFMGMSFRDYLNWCRILDYTRLKQRQPDISATKAAELCGFGSIKSFYRAQKKHGSINYIPNYFK